MNNPRHIVGAGYDLITQRYLEFVDSAEQALRRKYLDLLMGSLPDSAHILDLGCGAGTPITQLLAHHFRITGVDISRKQLHMARSKVPEAGFVRADIAHVPFADGVFDAVVAFYSIIHVPRDEHVGLMANVYRVLRPGGILVATMGASDCPDTVEKDWLGVPMFFSHYAGSANVALVQQVGFDIVSAEDEAQLEHGDPVSFRWIVASKPNDNGR